MRIGLIESHLKCVGEHENESHIKCLILESSDEGDDIMNNLCLCGYKFIDIETVTVPSK